MLLQVTGVNSPLKLVRTDANQQASLTYLGAGDGTDTIVATATVGGKELRSNRAQVTWGPGRHATFLTLNSSIKSGMSGSPVTVTASLVDVSQLPPAPIGGAEETAVQISPARRVEAARGRRLARCTGFGRLEV